MNVFHSQTDKNDIYENTPKLPIFLSLIANYKTEFDCELAIAMEVEETTLQRVKWKLKGWSNSQKKIEKIKSERKQVFLIHCDVVYEQDSWLIDQVNYLKTKPKVTTFNTPYNTKIWDSSDVGTPPKDDKQIQVRKWVNNKIVDNLSDLVTLGTAYGIPTKNALDKINLAVGVATDEKSAYKNALKLYIVDYWYDTSFYNVDTNMHEVLQGILNLLNLHNGWIVTVIKEAINEFKKEYRELWEVQESPLV